MNLEEGKKKAFRKAKEVAKDPSRLAGLMNDAQAKSRKVDQHLASLRKEFQLMIRLVKAWASGRYKDVGWSTIIIVVGAVLYFLDPIDLIPDFLPVIGYTDDLSVIAFALTRVRRELEKFEDWESEVTIE